MDTVRQYAPFLEHLRSEHRELHKQVDGVRQILKRGPNDLPLLVQSLVNLRSRLAAHFAEEEAGGCLEEAVSRRPSLGPVVDRLESEHPELLVDLDRIVSRSKANDGKQELTRTIEQFLDRLAAHEAGENRVLQAGLNFTEEAG